TEPPHPGEPARPHDAEGMMAEADRLAIEAVRRNEEAKTAQLRAEKKALQARLAGDAALVAADAVRMVQAAGFAAALARPGEACPPDRPRAAGPAPDAPPPASARIPSVMPGVATQLGPGPPSPHGAPVQMPSAPPPMGPGAPLGYAPRSGYPESAIATGPR